MNCFELFAGCGGLGYGFHKEEFNNGLHAVSFDLKGSKD